MPNLKHFKKSVPNKKDELYTPKILVDVIVPYIPKDKIVWCPFDTENSEFVLTLQEGGIQVVYSHIATGHDFFKYTPPEYDYIISNPPFSTKLKVFQRLYALGKPFAMIMGLPVLNYQQMGEFFYSQNSDLQLLIVDKKVSFDGNPSSFNNSYFCKDILPRDLVFEHLEHNNTGKFYIPSRMYKDFLRECIKMLDLLKINEG